MSYRAMEYELALAASAVRRARNRCSMPEPGPAVGPAVGGGGETRPRAASFGSGGTLAAARVSELLSDASFAVTIIDTRSEGEYAAGHIAGARLISSSGPGFDRSISALPRDAMYIVYCRRGNMSASIVKQMRSKGFEHVCDIRGGFHGWQSEGLPVKEGAA